MEDEKVQDFVNNDLVQDFFEFMESDIEPKNINFNLSSVTQLIALFIKKFELNYDDIIDTNEDPNSQSKLLIKELIKNEVITLENDYPVIKSVLQKLEIDDALDIFIEVAKLADEGIIIIDLFNMVFKQSHMNEQLIMKYEQLSSIEPFLFKEQLFFFIDGMKNIEFSSPNYLFHYLKCIHNVLDFLLMQKHFKFHQENIEKILEYCHKLVILQLKSDVNQSLIDETTIVFLTELIKKLDSSQTEKKACLQPLINIVQAAIINDIDQYERQSGILMLQLLARYLNTQSIQEIYPLIIMIIQISQFFQSPKVDLSSLQVMRYILNISDSHLFEIYGFELIQFFKKHFISNEQLVKQEAYQCITVLLREGIFEGQENSQQEEEKELKMSENNKLQANNRQIQDEVEAICNEILDTLKSNDDNQWLLNGLINILRVLQNEKLLNEIANQALDIKNHKILQFFVQIAIYKKLDIKVVAKFTTQIKSRIQRKFQLEDVLKCFLIIMKHNLFSEFLSPQKLVNLSTKFIIDQNAIIKSIDLNFDLTSELEVKFQQSVEIIRLSFKLLLAIFENKNNRNVGFKDEEIKALVFLSQLIHEQPQNFTRIIVIVSKFFPFIFNILNTDEQKEILKIYFVVGITNQKINIDDKILIINQLIDIIKNSDQEQLQKSLNDDILRYSQIIINHLNSTLKNGFENLNQNIMKIVYTLVKYQPQITISLQNVLYNEYVPKSLKNNQQIASFKIGSLKLLLKLLKYSKKAQDTIITTALEAFMNFMNEKSNSGIRHISMKSILYLFTVPEFDKLPKDVEKILENIGQQVIENQKQINDQTIQKTQCYCFNIVNIVLKGIIRGEFNDTSIRFDRMKPLINFWMLHLINLERKNHNNFDHVETFIQILLENQSVLIGRNNENLSGVLKILSLSLTEYCFEGEVESKIAKMLLSIQTQKPMMFVMATGILDANERQFINKLVETQGKEFDQDLEEDEDLNDQQS